MARDTGPSSQQQVNPALLVLLGIVVIGASIYYFTSKPGAPAPPAAPSQQPISTAGNTGSNNPDVSAGPTQEQTADQQMTAWNVLSRNPFLAPDIYLNNNEPGAPADNSSPNRQGPSAKPEATSDASKTASSPLNNEADLKLGGVFQKYNDKVALIYFRGKGFIIRENETLRNSGYRLAKISPNAVTLINDNGEEKTLRLEEKPLKLKGGGR